MKATGIVRRIDDLGRVVIPKEIRRVMRIREGDPLEIFTEGGGEVIFKKYSPVGENLEGAGECAQALSKETSLTVAVCDRDGCVAAAGQFAREIEGQSVSKQVEQVVEDRRALRAQNELTAFEGVSHQAAAIAPIVTAGDIAGCVILVKNEKKDTADETDLKLCSLAAKFLANKME